MSLSENTLRFMGTAIMKLQSQVQAQDLLLKAIYTERATQRGLFPKEAEEEIHSLISSVEEAPRSGYKGEENHLADVQASLRLFADGLRERLEGQI